MNRIRLVASTCLVALPAAGSLHAGEPVDQATLRAELAELKSLAAQLQTRIAQLKTQLHPPVAGPELKVNDFVIVEYDNRSTNQQVDGQAQTRSRKLVHLPAITAKVESILPSGEYALSGHRVYTANGIRYEETFSGIATKGRIDATRHVHSREIRELSIDVRQAFTQGPNAKR